MAALAATGSIAVLAFSGGRPEPGLVRFAPAGIMRHLPPERASEVEVITANARLRFARARDGRWVAAHGASAGAGTERVARLEEGLKLLHASAPERTIGADETGGAAAQEFGLAPPRLTVTVRADRTAPFTVHFGNPNPLGLARYARLEGRPGVLLLPAFLADAWERVVAEP